MNNLLKRYLPATVLSKNVSLQLTFNVKLNNVIQEILSKHIPNNVRRHVQMHYQGTAKFPLTTELAIDSFIAATFLDDYGSYLDIFRNLNNRYHLKPSKILEITNGPAPGLCALSDSRKNEEVIENAGVTDDEGIDTIIKPDQIDLFIDPPQTILHERAKQLFRSVSNKQMNILNALPFSKDVRYDLIVLSNLDYDMKAILNLLSTNGIILIKQDGTPKGFEKIAEFRSRLLKTDKFQPIIEIKSADKRKFQTFKTPSLFNGEYYKILEPCPHHNACPLQLGNAEYYNNHKKYMICSNSKSIERPPYILELKKGKLLAKDWNNTNTKYNKILRGKGRPFGRNWELINYSYLVVQKVNNYSNFSSHDISNIETQKLSEILSPITLKNDEYKDIWPRIVSTPNKQKGHIVMDICSSQGKLEKWITPKSLSGNVYHDARKSSRGDQWPHEPKTKLLTKSTIDKKKLKSNMKRKLKNEKLAKKSQVFENVNKLRETYEPESINGGKNKRNCHSNIDETSKIYGEIYENSLDKKKKFNI